MRFKHYIICVIDRFEKYVSSIQNQLICQYYLDFQLLILRFLYQLSFLFNFSIIPHNTQTILNLDYLSVPTEINYFFFLIL
jgi:hypothetical protein